MCFLFLPIAFNSRQKTTLITKCKKGTGREGNRRWNGLGYDDLQWYGEYREGKGKRLGYDAAFFDLKLFLPTKRAHTRISKGKRKGKEREGKE